MAQRVFEYDDKNVKLLAWLAKSQFAITHLGRIHDIDGQSLTFPEHIKLRLIYATSIFF